MKKSDIEIISAFLDNELSEAERSHFEERLITDEAFAQAFAAHSENEQALQQAFSAINETPIPDSILNLLRESEKEMPASKGKVVELNNWRGSKWLPIAASFLIVALALPAWLTMNEQDGPKVASVLDSELSGQTIEIDASTSLALVMSFSDKQGHFCREYLFLQSSITEQRVACKIDDVWHTKVSDMIDAVGGNNYQVASGEGANKIEMWLDLNMLGIPLSTSAEEENLSSSASQK
jgi:hypothetical protein